MKLRTVLQLILNFFFCAPNIYTPRDIHIHNSYYFYFYYLLSWLIVSKNSLDIIIIILVLTQNKHYFSENSSKRPLFRTTIYYFKLQTITIQFM